MSDEDISNLRLRLRGPDDLKDFNRRVVDEFRANNGRVGSPFENSDVILLTMTGAKTGKTRVAPLEYFMVDGRVIIVGTYGGAPQDPLWVLNIRANPQVRVELGKEAFDAFARELSGSERESVHRALLATAPRIAVYETRTDRAFPIFELRRT